MHPLAPEDVVPSLRPDLAVSPSAPGRGEGEVRVQHVASAQALVLKGFEVSIARMLNGRRTAQELLDNAEQIGLPLTLDALNRFLGKLERVGFIVDGEAPPQSDISTWQPRGEWSHAVRALFQDALREARADRFDTALARLDALLSQAPDTQEAVQLRAWVTNRLYPDIDLYSNRPPPPKFKEVFAEVEKSWFAEGEAISERNAAVVPESLDGVDIPEGTEFSIPQPSRSPKIIGIGVAVLIVICLIPLPHTASTTYTLLPHAMNPVKAPHAGTLGALAVTEGQVVTAGTVLAQWDSAALQKQIAALTAQVAEAQKAAAPRVPPAKLKAAKARLAKATALARVAAAKAAKAAAKSRGRKNSALEKKATQAAAAQTAAQSALDALTRPPDSAIPPALAAQLASAKAQLAEPPLTASSDGMVVQLTGHAGQVVKPGDVVMQLADTHTMQVAMPVPSGESMAQGTEVQLALPTPAKVTVEKVADGTATASLPNPGNAHKPGDTGSASFSGVTKSLFGRW